MSVKETRGKESCSEDDVRESFGENVFNLKAMKEYLSEKAYKALKATKENGKPIPPEIADEVAQAMKEWAVSKGATHYTHWFQPLTGATAEKHDAFVNPTGNGGAELRFDGKSLIQGEPDASSFPSGGIRPTFEARGYTAWDPTSPAFIKYEEEGKTLCIPTAFCAYTGEALDKKTPLLRSQQALSKSVHRLMELFDDDVPDKKANAELGWEQEYFLVDRELYLKRPDLIQTGRTLFGLAPAKHQQMNDHYFGAIKPRIVKFMEEVDRECWKLGIPAKTRHNEVSPAQFELAPVFEELNLSVDHNMLAMDVLDKVAQKHGLVCLLHEKPFAGVNGSGKHNNWNITAPDGSNLMDPGDNPHENAKFLTVLCAVIKAVDKHAKMLRAAVASAGNDHRLGGHEAPPAILSIYLGDQLTEIIEQIEKGSPAESKERDTMKLGVTSLPEFPRDVTDRNRTSPFAFTGNKFEFRAVGSNQSCAGSNAVLNTIVAEALDYICDRVEEEMSDGIEFNTALQKVLKEVVKEHKRVIFNGDNYSEEWLNEAKKRGLPNIEATDQALEALISEKTIKLFEQYSVLSERELRSRYEIYMENYEKNIDIEGKVAVDMAKTMILPAVLKSQRKLAKTLSDLRESSVDDKTVKNLEKQLEYMSGLIGDVYEGIDNLQKAIREEDTHGILEGVEGLRETVDALEAEVDDNLWPLPKYKELLFVY